MFIIRDVLIAKPGSAGKLARMMKGVMPHHSPNTKSTVMLDFVSDFNTIVIEHEVKSLAEFEKEMEEFKNDDKMKEMMKDYTELYLTGKREIFKVVD